jgi:quercetin dioxygenase-like cupin family protein
VALQGLRELEFKQLAPFNKGSVGVFRTSAGVSPWERHPDDHELLYVLDGEVEITVVTPEGWRTAAVTAGAVFIVPRGLWHRHTIRENLVELYVTPGETEHSTAGDPTAIDDRPERGSAG